MKLAPQISPMQLFIIFFNVAFGVSMATLPRVVAGEAKQDMWLAVIVGGVSFLFAVWVAAKLAAYFPRQTCIEYNRILLGPVLGQILNVFLIIMIAAIPAVSMRIFGVGMKIFLLESTPPQILMVIIIILLVYGAQHGLAPIIRLQEFNFGPTLFLFLVLMMGGFSVINTNNYLPFLAGGITPVLKGAIPVWYAYTGPEIVIGLLYPFITRQGEVFKWGAAAVGAVGVVYTVLTAIVQGILGHKETAFLLVPTLIAYRAVEIPDTFIERLDGYFVMLWIPIYFFCMLNWVYLACFGAARMMKLESSRPLVVLLAPVIYYLIMAIPTYQDIITVNTWVNMAFIAWGLVILPLLLLLSWLRARKVGTLIEGTPRQK